VETAALWKAVEKSNGDFPTAFHRAWKTLRRKGSEFPTVPTASTAGFVYAYNRYFKKQAAHLYFAWGPMENSPPKTFLVKKPGKRNSWPTCFASLPEHPFFNSAYFAKPDISILVRSGHFYFGLTLLKIFLDIV
jgi:hypothetical protein